MSEREWSKFQQAIFADFEDDSGNTVIQARAGSGKTSTIVAGLDFVPGRRSALLCAFNKSIQRDLQERAPRWADVRTLHSAGLLAIRRAFGNVAIDEAKTKILAKAAIREHERGRELELGDDIEKHRDLEDAKIAGAGAIAKLVGYAKNALVSEDDLLELEMIAIDRDLESDQLRSDAMARIASAVLKASAEAKSVIDFDDMVWFPARHGLRPESHDIVCIDEAQDLNPAQSYLVRALVKKKGRIVAVGDVFQAIYGFRAATPEVMIRLVREGARELPLSITYRCPKKVVDLAREFVPDFEAAPGAIEGTVNYLSDPDAIVPLARPGDFVLSRTNAPLMKICLSLLARGVPACVAGRDVGKGLTDLIARADTDDVGSLLDWVHAWREEQVARYMARDQEAKIEIVIDKVAMIEALAEGEALVSDMVAKIERLFRDDDPKTRVVCSTVHKAKGLERDRVFLVAPTFRPVRQEEQNIYYVAITRAKRDLFFAGKLGGSEIR